MAAVDLAPVPTPLAVFPSFIAQCPTTFIMKESIFSLTGDDFTIKTLDGRKIFKVKASLFSVSSRMLVHDSENKHLFTLHKKIFSIPRSFYAESPEGTKIFEVEGKYRFGSTKAVGHFLNAMNGEQEKLQLQGNFFNIKTEITNKKNGQVVAQIDRQLWNARQLLADRDTYAVTVAPGVDMALIVAMVVCLDERRE